MYFKNRAAAAVGLAERLMHYRGEHPLVVGVPRGGVPMARIVADALAAELDVVLVRKLRAPGQQELAIGAVDESGTVLEGEYFGLAPAGHVREEVRTEREILRMRRELYTKAQPPIDPAGRVVIIVDDGVVTDDMVVAALRRPAGKTAQLHHGDRSFKGAGV